MPTTKGRPAVLITGGTGSLGLHAAQAVLAVGGRDVIITGRRPSAVADACRRLGNGAHGMALDLGSLAEVSRAARDLPQLDAVICNAGTHTTRGITFTADGIEETFGVNHLAHFLLVRELLPTMAAAARVVFVSSGTHDPARRTGFPAPRYTTARDLAHPSDTATESPFRAGRRRYTASKLCNVLAAYEFARRVPPEVATFNVFDPGQMPATGIARDYRGVRGFAWRHVLPLLTMVPGNDIHTPTRSAAGLVRLLVDPALTGVTGGYFAGIRRTRSSDESYDAALAKDLWDTSIELVRSHVGASWES